MKSESESAPLPLPPSPSAPPRLFAPFSEGHTRGRSWQHVRRRLRAFHHAATHDADPPQQAEERDRVQPRTDEEAHASDHGTGFQPSTWSSRTEYCGSTPRIHRPAAVLLRSGRTICYGISSRTLESISFSRRTSRPPCPSGLHPTHGRGEKVDIVPPSPEHHEAIHDVKTTDHVPTIEQRQTSTIFRFP